MSYYNKIKSWLPDHFTTNDYETFLRETALTLDEARDLKDEFIRQTKISECDEEYLKIYAKERKVPRVFYGAVPEQIDFWRNRIQRIKFNRTKENIKANIRSVINITEIDIIDDNGGASFLSGASDKRASQISVDQTSYGWYGPIGWEKYKNGISILLETPIPEPDAFYDDTEFFDDKSFMGTREKQVNSDIILAIKTLVGQKVAAGTPWRLLVKGFTGLTPGTIAEQEAELNTF